MKNVYEVTDSESSSSSYASCPSAFVKRRLHSLTGLGFLLFLCEHLLTNSRAASFFNDHGQGFINSVNWIHSLPYLHVIEITLVGLPIVLHGFWGVLYLFSGQPNSFKTDGSTPQLRNLTRNHAYTWQRITSVILLVGIVWHVSYMRFYIYPQEEVHKKGALYVVKVTADEKLIPLSQQTETVIRTVGPNSTKLEAITPSFGAAIYFNVRETFKSTTACILYSIFVFAAAFHGSNGLWTFAVSWGLTISERSRHLMRRCTNVLMCILITLGLMAIWGVHAA